MDNNTRDLKVADGEKREIVALEDSIMRKGIPSLAGSEILTGFMAPFDAAVAERLQDSYTLTTIADMDEFGIDRFSDDKPETEMGAVSAVASGAAAYALVNDVFGKAKRQAPAKGLCYIHPTYGMVSRYGLIPVASSMDQIGIVCRNITEGFRLLSVIAGKDERDGAMYSESSYVCDASPSDKNGKIRMAVPGNAWANARDEENEALAHLKSIFDAVPMNLAHFEVYPQVLYILAAAEICNNTNRYDGIKFGYRSQRHRGVNDLYVNTRSEALGREAKLAVIMGAAVLSHECYVPYYEKAMKIRRLIRDALDFSTYDVIALPARCDGTPYAQSALYAPAVLAGLPSVSIPVKNGCIQLIANRKNEAVLAAAWEALCL